MKNLAEMSDVSLLPVFVKYASEDESTEVRREAVSAIGRLRHERAIPALIKFLANSDPKVVMQAIRRLLVFADNPSYKMGDEIYTIGFPLNHILGDSPRLNKGLIRTYPRINRRKGGLFSRDEARSEDDGVVGQALRQGRATKPQSEKITSLTTRDFRIGSSSTVGPKLKIIIIIYRFPQKYSRATAAVRF